MPKKKVESLDSEVTLENLSKFDSPDFKELVRSLQKENGNFSVLKASDERVSVFPKIPTEIFQLDYALGGGIPVGKVNLFYGPFSSMKTSLILRIVGNAQRRCADCWKLETEHGVKESGSCSSFNKVSVAFIDMEKTFDGAWASKLGADCDNIMVFQPPYGEKAVDVSDQLLRSGKIDILILDSLAALVPFREIEKSAEDMVIGAQAKLINTLCRKTLNATLEAQTTTGKSPTIFWTNQTREKITMFGNPETMSGGKAPPFLASTMLRLERGKAYFESERQKEEAPLYIPIDFKITKNKAGVPNMEGEFRLITTNTDEKRIGSIYDENKVSELAVKCGLLKQQGDGKKMWYFNDEPVGIASSSFERKLLIDTDYSNHARKLIMEKLNELRK